MDTQTQKMLDQAARQATAPTFPSQAPAPQAQRLLVNIEINGEMQQVPVEIAQLYALHAILDQVTRLAAMLDTSTYAPLEAVGADEP